MIPVSTRSPILFKLGIHWVLIMRETFAVDGKQGFSQSQHTLAWGIPSQIQAPANDPAQQALWNTDHIHRPTIVSYMWYSMNIQRVQILASLHLICIHYNIRRSLWIKDLKYYTM